MKIRDIFQYVLGAIVVIGFFALLIILVLVRVPDANKDLLHLAVGVLLAAFSSVVGYFYGSSAGSAAKNEMMVKKEPYNTHNP